MQAVGAFRGQDMCGSNLELLALVDGLSTVVEGHPDPVQGWREKFRGGNSCRSASGYLGKPGRFKLHLFKTSL